MQKKHYIKILLIAAFGYIFLLPSFVSRPDAASCKNPRPASAPVLLSAVPHDRSVELVWKEAQDPVTHYLIRYGLSKENFEYGNPNIGGRGTVSFTVAELTNGTKYYFQVRAENGCKPGKFSNTLTAIPGQVGQNSLGLKGPKNLSIYKPVGQVAGEATTSSAQKPEEAKRTPPLSSAETKKACVFSCWGAPLLGAEVVSLLLFFNYSKKYSHFKPTFSALIPLSAIVIFSTTQGRCNSSSFYCQNFIPLSIIIFITIFTLQKYNYLKPKIE